MRIGFFIFFVTENNHTSGMIHVCFNQVTDMGWIPPPVSDASQFRRKKEFRFSIILSKNSDSGFPKVFQIVLVKLLEQDI